MNGRHADAGAGPTDVDAPPDVDASPDVDAPPSLAAGRVTRERTPRDRKFRQAAWVYLHVGILYEAAAYAMWQNGVLPTGGMGPPWLWLVFGAVIAFGVFAGLCWWQNRWFARVIWGFHALRLPALISGAFLRGTDGDIAPAFYATALVVVVINLGFLARAGWDI